MTVEELLTKKKLPFRISGRDFVISCLNPEHDDSSPSMRVDKISGIFNCFSCGFKGNLFYYYGEEFDKLSTSRELLRRKLDDIRAQSIGLKMPANSALVSSDYRVSLDTLTEFEAFRTTSKDLVDRIVFPIKDIKGKTVCFIGRAEDPFAVPKYKIVPDNAKVPLFPVAKVKPVNGRVMLVEGLFDLLNLYDNGYRNVLCTFGTRLLTEEKLKFLKLLGVTGVDICYDPDKAGREAAEEAVEMAEEVDLTARNINLKNCDPGDLSATRAENLYKKLYD